jgi:predicted PurR-regulated permease PerM
MLENDDYVARAFEIAIRLGLALGLVLWCFQIIRPFIGVIVWGLIIAVAMFPVYAWMLKKLHDRRGLTATLLTVIMLVAIMTPTFELSATLVDSSRGMAAQVENGDLNIPPPKASVKDWPIIGATVYEIWEQANANISDALKRFEPQIKTAGTWLLSTAAGAGLAILQFGASIIVAGIFLTFFEGGGVLARRLGKRLAGEQGDQFADLATSTIRSVAQGVLGVAFIQSMLAGIGFLVVGIPAAGLWTLLCLILATVQLGTTLVMAPTVIYVFNVADTTTAVLYTIWAVFVSLLDNILKPILLGRGVKVPMAVIFMGAIGGFIMMGIIGLFVGAVLLVLAYELFTAWLEPAPNTPENAAHE